MSSPDIRVAVAETKDKIARCHEVMREITDTPGHCGEFVARVQQQ